MHYPNLKLEWIMNNIEIPLSLKTRAITDHLDQFIAE